MDLLPYKFATISLHLNNFNSNCVHQIIILLYNVNARLCEQKAPTRRHLLRIVGQELECDTELFSCPKKSLPELPNP